MIYLQYSSIDHAQFYRGDAAWMGLFGPQRQYFKPAYTYRATATLLNTPERLELTGADTFRFAAIAGRSRDGKTVQILVSNYEIPPDFKPHQMQIPAAVQAQMQFDFSKIKVLPRRTDIPRGNNLGYALTIDNLPWGNKAFTVKRYRITKTEDFALVEERASKGGKLEISNPLPPPGVELIVLQQR